VSTDDTREIADLIDASCDVRINSFDRERIAANVAAHVAAAVAERDAEIERLRFESEQARLAAIHAEEYARHTDTLVGIIRDSQERLARPGQRLADVKEILHRLPHAARQEREDRQLRDRDNTPLATRIAERADLEAEILRLRTLIEEEIETPAEAERDEARAALGAVAALADEYAASPYVEYQGWRVDADLRERLAPVSGAVAKPDDDHTSDGRCKYPKTCETEGRHTAGAVEEAAPELLVLQVYLRGEWVTQVGYSWTPDDFAKAHDEAETSVFTARVIPVYAASTPVAKHEQEVAAEERELADLVTTLRRHTSMTGDGFDRTMQRLLEIAARTPGSDAR